MNSARAVRLALAALAAICAACGSYPLAGECSQLSGSSAAVQIAPESDPGNPTGCPAIAPFTVDENGSAPCGDGCTCTLGGYQTGTDDGSSGVFGPEDVEEVCEATLTRACTGQDSIRCNLFVWETQPSDSGQRLRACQPRALPVDRDGHGVGL